MIITFTGFKNRKNKSTFAVALVSAMCSLTKGTKTLVLQLGEKDVESVEYYLTGAEEVKVFVDKGLTFTNEGIDGLIRTVESIKLNKEEFDQMCLSLRKDNRLDISEMTKNASFVSTLSQKTDNVKQILRNASEVYDDIFVLLPYTNDEVVKEINELEIVDRCVYCMKQGVISPGKIHGANPVVLFMDYDEDSMYNMKYMRNMLKLKKNVVTRKINYNTKAKDAARSNQLLGFIAQNRDLSKEDINYQWMKDVKELIEDLLGISEGYLQPNYQWEKVKTYAEYKESLLKVAQEDVIINVSKDVIRNVEKSEMFKNNSSLVVHGGKGQLLKSHLKETVNDTDFLSQNMGRTTIAGVEENEPKKESLFARLFKKKDKNPNELKTTQEETISLDNEKEQATLVSLEEILEEEAVEKKKKTSKRKTKKEDSADEKALKETKKSKVVADTKKEEDAKPKEKKASPKTTSNTKSKTSDEEKPTKKTATKKTSIKKEVTSKEAVEEKTEEKANTKKASSRAKKTESEKEKESKASEKKTKTTKKVEKKDEVIKTEETSKSKTTKAKTTKATVSKKKSTDE